MGKSVPQIQAMLLPLLLQNSQRQLSLPPKKEITLPQLLQLLQLLNKQTELVPVATLQFWQSGVEKHQLQKRASHAPELLVLAGNEANF